MNRLSWHRHHRAEPSGPSHILRDTLALIACVAVSAPLFVLLGAW